MKKPKRLFTFQSFTKFSKNSLAGENYKIFRKHWLIWWIKFYFHEFDRLGLSHLITSSLGKRGSFSTYSYVDIIKNLCLIYFSGGDCAEDIQTNLKDEFKNIKNVKWCSADTILRLQKELSKEKEIKKSKSGIEIKSIPILASMP